MEKEFVKIRNMGDRATFGITEGEVEASEKLDGCFSYETLISTNIGALTIGSIVNKKLDVLVKSFNKDTNLIEYKPIINFWKNGSGTNWIDLVIESEKGLKHITMTDNHKVFDGNIFKPISNFNIGDNVYISTPQLSAHQYSLMLGGILGDGSIENMNLSKNPYYRETHCTKQLDYLIFKMNAFNNLGITYDTRLSAYNESYEKTIHHIFRTKSLFCIKNAFTSLYNNGKKYINNNIVNMITPLAIAIWYCDDGSGGICDTQRARAAFHTEGFSYGECVILTKCLEKYNINSKIFNYGKGNYIQLSADDTEKLFDLIAQYIIPSMQYKLSPAYRNKFIPIVDIEKNISPFKIISMSKTIPRYNQKYDIEVADNHNYFANGMLVSNSNFSWYVKDDDTLVFRSHHTVLGGGLENGAAWKLAVQLITNAHAKTPFKTGYMYFGESMCKPHRINYGDSVSPFYGFAIRNEKYGIYIKNWKEIFSAYNIPTVSTIILHDPTVEQMKDMVHRQSVINPDKACEGMVFKNYELQKFAKIVADEFRESSMQKIKQECKILDETPSIVDTYCNYARVVKRVHEFCDESNLPLGMELMPKLVPILRSDILTECIIEISEKFGNMDFRKFNKLVAASCAKHLKHLIES